MKLSIHQQMLVEQKLAYQKRSAPIAYLLWFFFGTLSAHRFYLGRVGSGLTQLFLFWSGVVFSYVLIGLPLLLFATLWILLDVVLIYLIVSKDTLALREKIMSDVAQTTIPYPQAPTPHYIHPTPPYAHSQSYHLPPQPYHQPPHPYHQPPHPYHQPPHQGGPRPPSPPLQGHGQYPQD